VRRIPLSDRVGPIFIGRRQLARSYVIAACCMSWFPPSLLLLSLLRRCRSRRWPLDAASARRRRQRASVQKSVNDGRRLFSFSTYSQCCRLLGLPLRTLRSSLAADRCADCVESHNACVQPFAAVTTDAKHVIVYHSSLSSSYIKRTFAVANTFSSIFNEFIEDHQCFTDGVSGKGIRHMQP